MKLTIFSEYQRINIFINIIPKFVHTYSITLYLRMKACVKISTFVSGLEHHLGHEVIKFPTRNTIMLENCAISNLICAAETGWN